jgi:hypothetical protein
MFVLILKMFRFLFQRAVKVAEFAAANHNYTEDIKESVSLTSHYYNTFLWLSKDLTL